jgi:hypothetical protein
MPNKLIERLRGSLSTLLYFFNTLFWFVPYPSPHMSEAWRGF